MMNALARRQQPSEQIIDDFTAGFRGLDPSPARFAGPQG